MTSISLRLLGDAMALQSHTVAVQEQAAGNDTSGKS